MMSPESAIPESERRHAIDRIGRTLLSRMQWVLKFLEADLTEPSESDVLNLRYDFLAVGDAPLLKWRARDGNKGWWRLRGPAHSLSIEQLRAVQARWTALVDDWRQMKPGEKEFRVPMPRSYWIIEREETGGFKQHIRTSTSPADPPLLSMLVDLLTEFGHKIRDCDECHRRYLAVRERQRFCSRRCQNRDSFRAKQRRDAEALALATKPPAATRSPKPRPRPQPARTRHAKRQRVRGALVRT